MQEITVSKDIESRVDQFYKLKQETLCQGCKMPYDTADKLPKTLPCGCVQCLKCLEQQQEEKEDINCTVHKQEFSNVFRAEQLETDQTLLQKMALLKVLSKYDKNQLESVSQLIDWKNQYIEGLLHAKNEIVKEIIKNVLTQQESLQSKYNEIMTSLKNQNYSNSLEFQGFININELLNLIDNSFEFTLQEEIESTQSRQSITIYRFDNITKGWPCTGRGLDCITFQTNINCRLVGIGLFVPDVQDTYSILDQFMVYEGKGSSDILIYDHMVEIKQSTLDFLNPEVKIRSKDCDTPTLSIMTYRKIQITKHTDYTVKVLIKCDNSHKAAFSSYGGNEGTKLQSSESKVFQVKFQTTIFGVNDKSNGTTLYGGQIPEILFEYYG